MVTSVCDTCTGRSVTVGPLGSNTSVCDTCTGRSIVVGASVCDTCKCTDRSIAVRFCF